jgi:hypothetical protein
VAHPPREGPPFPFGGSHDHSPQARDVAGLEPLGAVPIGEPGRLGNLVDAALDPFDDPGSRPKGIPPEAMSTTWDGQSCGSSQSAPRRAADMGPGPVVLPAPSSFGDRVSADRWSWCGSRSGLDAVEPVVTVGFSSDG